MIVPTYYIEGLFRQANDEDARTYLKIPTTALPFVPPNGILKGDGVSVGTVVVGDGLSYDGTTLIATGGDSASAIFRFDTAVTGTDPGSGKVKLNSATFAGATNINIDQFTKAGTDVTNWIMALRSGDTVAIQDRADSTKRARYTVNANPVNNTGWFTITVTHVASTGTVPANNADVVVMAFYGGGGGGGTVTNTNNLDDHCVVVGNGGVDVSTIPIGTTNTVLHGNTGADPSFSQVVEADILLADNTTNNVTTSKHGFAPKLSGVSTEYLDGDGNYSVPDGSISTFVESSLTASGGGLTTSDPVGVQRIELGTLSSEACSSNALKAVGYTTSTILDNDAGAASTNGGGDHWIYGRKHDYIAWVIPLTNSNARYWVGISDLSISSQGASDTPTGNYGMFRYSTSAGDTNWKAVVGNGSSTEVFDTGVAVSNSVMVKLEVKWDGTAANSFDFFIDGVSVAVGTLDPASGTLFRFGATVRNLLGGSTRKISVAAQKVRAYYP